MSKDKGVVKLNPTKEVMKQGSKAARGEHERHEENYPAPKASGSRPIAADEGHETKVFPTTHPMMKTRHSNPAEEKHADGRKHEDHHHAVRRLKGK
jgi:hypothetical protein